MDIIEYIDASFDSHCDHTGHGGAIIKLNNSSSGVYFKSNKQKRVADSPMESELIALNEHYKMGIWISWILEELGIQTKNSYVTIHQDNMANIFCNTTDACFQGKSKFINRKYFSTKQRIDDGEIMLKYLNTKLMLADILTKSMPTKQFKNLRDIMMGYHDNNSSITVRGGNVGLSNS